MCLHDSPDTFFANFYQKEIRAMDGSSTDSIRNWLLDCACPVVVRIVPVQSWLPCPVVVHWIVPVQS